MSKSRSTVLDVVDWPEAKVKSRERSHGEEMLEALHMQQEKREQQPSWTAQHNSTQSGLHSSKDLNTSAYKNPSLVSITYFSNSSPLYNFPSTSSFLLTNSHYTCMYLYYNLCTMLVFSELKKAHMWMNCLLKRVDLCYI